MLFTSYLFICLFLPVTLAVFLLLGWMKRFELAKLWLVFASLSFYGHWNARFVGLLVASFTLNYAFGLLIARARPSRNAGYLLALSVSLNLACLAYFKYANFFIENINAFSPGALSTLQVTLPLGISFYTFTQIAFLVDVYRSIAVEFNFKNYALFVTYFPHLIAGPILHHKQMMPQFADHARYRARADNLIIGLTYFCMGLVKKLFIADQLSPYASTAFATSEHGPVPFMAAWGGALAYTFQLYFDFSGYCDMAIGLSRMFGIQLPFNFNSPYQATSIIDFWRRWHMTLSAFLRDYVYIPFGGNRKGKVRRHINLLATMFLGGLWHGANWTFVLWGVLHGVLLVINHVWNDFCDRTGLVFRNPRVIRTVSIAVTFLCVMVLWIFFRATTFSSAEHMLVGMTGATGFDFPRNFAPILQGWHLPGADFGRELFVTDANGHPHVVHFPWGILGLALVITFASRNSQEIIMRAEAIHWETSPIARLIHVAWGLALAFTICASLLQVTQRSEFLYFQF